jgi:hypothetical protein
MIPPFDPKTGCLPPGVHGATWGEIVERFGVGERRSVISHGLETALQIFHSAGAEHAHLGGSFVTAKREPGDFDGCFDDGETFDWKRFHSLSSHLSERLPGHLTPESNPDPTGDGPPCLDFLQADPRIGVKKGVVYLNLDTLPAPEQGSPAWRAITAVDWFILAPSQQSSLTGGQPMTQERPRQQDASRQLAERAAHDPRFRQQLIDNPRQAVQEELGMDIPEDIEITVLEETPSQVYVVLPATIPSGQGLSDSDLEHAAGGLAPTTISMAGGVCV